MAQKQRLSRIAMTDYPIVKSLLETELKRQEHTYPLMEPAFHSLVMLHSQPTERVCLCLHGFTAGP
ncbi:MAG TPA: hypothetical protein V6D06_08975, partial [Trichocoleus sp.]